jgi:hypothetical protein
LSLASWYHNHRTCIVANPTIVPFLSMLCIPHGRTTACFWFTAVHIFSDAVLLLWPFGGRWSLRSLRGWAAWAWTCSAEPSTILRQITTNHVQWQMEMVLHPLGISRTGCDDDIMWYPAPSSTTDFHSLYPFILGGKPMNLFNPVHSSDRSLPLLNSWPCIYHHCCVFIILYHSSLLHKSMLNSIWIAVQPV